ncbi:MAG: hypothetical protein PHW00_01670 [Clostridia bacterium]|nr:hypothetical protein [Clostridia bacterium]
MKRVIFFIILILLVLFNLYCILLAPYIPSISVFGKTDAVTMQLTGCISAFLASFLAFFGGYTKILSTRTANRVLTVSATIYLFIQLLYLVVVLVAIKYIDVLTDWFTWVR